MVKLLEYIRLALLEIIHNKTRTFLTLIGIIIGIAAVMIIIFVVQGAEDYIMTELSRIAPLDIMQVSGRWDPESRRILGNITEEDVEFIGKQEGYRIRAMAPRYWNNGKLTYHGNEFDCNLIPTTPSFWEIYDLDLSKGRFLTDLDIENFNQVIVLGYDSAENLFKNSNPVGKKVRLFGVTFKVIGVLPKDYESPIFPVSINDTRGFIPISVVERLGGFKNRFTLMIRVENREQLQPVMNRVIKLLNLRHGLTDDGKSKFRARQLANGLDMVNIIKMVLMLLLTGVASITLLVAGIGVMNIMLVIVTERTKEIGLRKAIGATRRDIMTQFIIESIILCFFGGMIGIISGYFGCNLVLDIANRFINLQIGIPLWSVLVSLIFTTGVGLFFGIYPAYKASRLNPIEALHYE